MGIYWPHLENAKQQRYATGKRKREDQTNTWQHHAHGAELATIGEDRTGQETLESRCAWPILQEEPRA